MTYFCLFLLSLSVCNVYIVWLLMEMMLLFFLLYVLSFEVKSVGLVVYFFFQSVMSLMLFVVVFFGMSKLVILVLVAKLGLFPFFYWVVVVSVKISFWSNMFVLALQKFVLFWLVWLCFECSVSMIYMLVYSSIFFVMVNLLMVSDLWLLLVYSSIANTGMILLSVLGSNYMSIVFLYLGMVVTIIFYMKEMNSYDEGMMVVFFFLVIPPFMLFFMKLYMFISLEFVLKLAFLIAIFDVFVLLYYFSMVFMKFMLSEAGVLVYLMNFMVLFCMVVFSNCVTMIVFN